MKHCYALILMVLAFALAQGQTTISMPSSGTQTVELQPGMVYTVLDPGGTGLYPNNCNSYLLLQSSNGTPIRITGSYNTEQCCDYLRIFDNNVTSGSYSQYAGTGSALDITCSSGNAMLYFHSDVSVVSDGFELTVTVYCPLEITSATAVELTDSSATVTWVDTSNATHWTVEYGPHPDSLTQSVSASSPQATLTELIPGHLYYYRIFNNSNQTSSICTYIPSYQFRTPCREVVVDTHDVATGPILIPAHSCTNYVITGTTTNTGHYVEIENGYHGTIVLRDLDMSFSGSGYHSPIRIVGQNNLSNLTPNTDVNFILDGENRIYNNGNYRACIQVDQGTTARFSAIDPNNNFSGSLCVTQANSNGGAGIGALEGFNYYNQAHATAHLTSGGTSTVNTAGGNIVVSSGIIIAKGGHGAGIGGGYDTYYDGIILIYGGIVRTSCVRHAAGIGSGCPTGSGVIDQYTPNSTIIALPPADIVSTGATGENTVVPSLGLAGTNTLVYIGDPNKPLITVRTEDYEPQADVYVDLSQNEAVAAVCNLLAGDRFDINQVHFGATDANGLYQFHGLLQDSTTFFTDATSSSDSHLGSPYNAVTTTLTNGGTVVMPRIDLDFSKTEMPASHLFEGYTAAEAQASAFRLRVEYNDATPLTHFSVDLAQGSASPFSGLSLFGPDDVTPFSGTTLSAGDTVFIHCPLPAGRPASKNLDVIRISGQRNGQSIGYIRQVVTQHVIHCDTAIICETGQYELPNGNVITQSGIYFDTLHGTISGSESVSFSCNGVTLSSSATTSTQRDSVLAILLSVMPAPHDTLIAQACDSLFWQGEWRTATGTYSHISPSSQACDSLHILHLTIHPSSLTSLPAVHHCLSHSWQGMEVSTTGDTLLRAEYTTSYGCDSIILLPLTLHDSSSVVLDPEEHCYGYTWNGTLYTQIGTQTLRHLAQNQWGCDSATYLTLTLHDSASVTLPHVDACDHYDWNNMHIDTSGEYRLSHLATTSHGCDSITYLPLSLHDTSLSILQVETCDHYLWNGQDLDQSDTYTIAGLTSFGCDSLCILQLTLHDSSSVVLPPEEHCYGYTWNGTLYTQMDTQTLRHFAQNQWGCDSATYLTLTLHDSASVTLPHVDACDHYDWNNMHVDIPGEYRLTHLTTTSHGCDSTTYLPLSLHDTSLAILQVEACDHYLWNGETLDQTGTYTAEGLTSFGCDSLCILHLDIKPEYHYTTQMRMCENSGTVWYEGEAYHETGIYERHMHSIHGCDSIETLNLAIEPTPHPILKVNPEMVDLDNLQVHIEDKCAYPCHHNWFIDGEPYGSDVAQFYYDYPIAQDSVCILLINQSLNAYCSDTATRAVYIRKGIAWTPNVFTPDMPTNNRFSVAFEGVGQATVTIYSRQGQLVAEFDGLTGSWDGTRNGTPCPQGTYIYIARYSTHTAPKNTLTQRGTITLLR